MFFCVSSLQRTAGALPELQRRHHGCRGSSGTLRSSSSGLACRTLGMRWSSLGQNALGPSGKFGVPKRSGGLTALLAPLRRVDHGSPQGHACLKNVDR